MKPSRSLLAGLVRRPLHQPPKPLPPPPWKGRSKALHIALSRELDHGEAQETQAWALHDRLVSKHIYDSPSIFRRATPSPTPRASPLSTVMKILKSDRFKGAVFLCTPTLIVAFMFHHFDKDLDLERELELRVDWWKETRPLTYWRYDNLVGDWVRDRSYEEQHLENALNGLTFHEAGEMQSENTWSDIRKTYMSRDGHSAVNAEVGKVKPWVDKKRLLLGIPRNKLDIHWFSRNALFNSAEAF